MIGTVIKVHARLNQGIIITQEGRKLRFDLAHITNPQHKLAGCEVDFVMVAGQPRAIVALIGSPWEAFGTIGALQSKEAQATATSPAAVTPIDWCDVPPVSEIDLAIPMHVLVSGGYASALIHGATAAQRLAVEREMEALYDVDAQTLSPVLVRFWAVVDAFQHRRIQTLFLQHGHGILGQFIAAACEQRLNAKRGFMPQRLIDTVTASMRQTTKVAPKTHRTGSWSPARPVPANDTFEHRLHG